MDDRVINTEVPTTGHWEQTALSARPRRTRMLEDYETSTSDALAASFGLDYEVRGIFQQVYRGHSGTSKYGISRMYDSLVGNEQFYISPDVANQIGKDYGLKFDKPVTDYELGSEIELARKAMRYNSIIQRSPSTISSSAAMFATGILSSIADPIELTASILVPPIGEARVAALASRLGGRTGTARAAAGLAEGAVGAAAIEPARAIMATNEQVDYDMYDAMFSIATGSAMGGGLRYAGGLIGDKIKNSQTLPEVMTVEPISESVYVTSGRKYSAVDTYTSLSNETKLHAMRAGIADFLEGRDLNIEPIIKLDPAYSASPRVLTKVLSVGDEVKMSYSNQRKLLAEPVDNLVVFNEAVLNSRGMADDYIRSKSRELGINRNKFFIEKTDDGKYNIIRTSEASFVDDESGNVLEIKSSRIAKKKAAKLNETAPDKNEYVYKDVKRKNADNEDVFSIIKSKGGSADDLEKISKSGLFLRGEGGVSGFEADIDYSRPSEIAKDIDISKIVSEYAKEKLSDLSPMRGIPQRQALVLNENDTDIFMKTQELSNDFEFLKNNIKENPELYKDHDIINEVINIFEESKKELDELNSQADAINKFIDCIGAR